MTEAPEMQAEMLLPTSDLTADMQFFTKKLGFRLDTIFPADDPAVAVISGHGVRLRLQRGVEVPAGTLRILARDPSVVADGLTELTAPNGTRVEIARQDPPMEIPATRHEFMVRRLADEAPWVIGRAGMHYRDLIPDRLGGSIIASHIRIPDGGPVPDMVHYHTIGFQLIFCYRGWVDLVYEDQGPPFRLNAGDCVIQPPEIRHRVLYASDNIEVIEIGVPAEHVTTIDHEMTLPTPHHRPDRDFGGQVFCLHRVEGAEWSPWRIPGFICRDTGITGATRGVAGVQVVRAEAPESPAFSNDADILFSFVMQGRMVLSGAGQPDQVLSPGDAFVVPPGMTIRFLDCSDDLEILEVALPGAVTSEIAA